MDQIEYIYQCVTEALALEESEVVGKSVRISNLRYIKKQMARLVNRPTIDRAEDRAAKLVENIRARK